MKSIHSVLAVVLLIGFSLTTTVYSVPSVPLSQDDFNSTDVVDSGLLAIAPAAASAAATTAFKTFISYRRSSSRHLAMLIKVLLEQNKVPAYLDVEDLQAGHWDDQLMNNIKAAPNFIFILSKGTLDRCINDPSFKDVVHQEIREAVGNKNKNIILIDDDFVKPEGKLTQQVIDLLTKKKVKWNPSKVDETVKELVGSLKNSR